MHMNIDEHILEDLLILPGHLNKEELNSALEYAKKKQITLDKALIAKDLISDENLSRVIADHLNYRFVNLNEVRIDENCLRLLPEVVARAQQSIFFGRNEDTLKIATQNTNNYEFIKFLEKKTGKKIDIYYTTHSSLAAALRQYKGDIRDQVEGLIRQCESGQQEGDIVRLVDLFLEYAYDNRASDIHIEPHEEEVLVRFRVDGLLYEATKYAKSLHEKIVFRIKIMARLQTDEHATAQDGRLSFTVGGSTSDVRVSLMPVTDGENVVMRILASDVEHFTLENLGLAQRDLEKVYTAASKPHGLILAVGPTGSGKTTTLYTILRILNKPEVNIMTIEDPTEYDIEQVQQTQVNRKKNLTFATGLRSIVRQDPDIIMVGEIRDEETADIAINAAMTGHLLLSTLHTNDAATTFPRLIEMGIEPFLSASSVHVVIAQRLVRKICNACRKSYVPSRREKEALKRSPKILACLQAITGKDTLSNLRFYKGGGCKLCKGSGYSGRIGIFEVLEATEEIRLLITQKASADVINEKAKELGMFPLLYDGLNKVISGVTTIEEVIKTVKT